MAKEIPNDKPKSKQETVRKKNTKHDFVISREADRKKEFSEMIDSKFKFYGEILAQLDEYVSLYRINEHGKIVKPTSVIEIEKGKKSVAMKPLVRIMDDREKKLEQFVADARREKGVIDVVSSLSALIITYDSSVYIPKIVENEGVLSEDGIRGFYSATDEHSLGLIAIDLNKRLRKDDGVLPSTSLIHELQHHTRALIDIALAFGDTATATASRRSAHKNLVEKIKGTSFRSNWDRLLDDKLIYEAILGRAVSQKGDLGELQRTSDDITAQRAYLDELHSSYLQKKSSWFVADGRVYSTEKKGQHHELVGRNPDDIASAKNLLCFLQGMYCAQQLHANMLTAPRERRENAFRTTLGFKELYVDFSSTFVKFGALLGISRAVQQAQRFAEDEWKKLMKNPFFQQQIGRYLENFETWKGAGATASTGETMRNYLMK